MLDYTEAYALPTNLHWKVYAFINEVVSNTAFGFQVLKSTARVLTNDGVPIGGVNFKHDKVYLLNSYVGDKLPAVYLKGLGFEKTYRPRGTCGSCFWEIKGAENVHALRIALQELSDSAS